MNEWAQSAAIAVVIISLNPRYTFGLFPSFCKFSAVAFLALSNLPDAAFRWTIVALIGVHEFVVFKTRKHIDKSDYGNLASVLLGTIPLIIFILTYTKGVDWCAWVASMLLLLSVAPMFKMGDRIFQKTKLFNILSQTPSLLQTEETQTQTSKSSSSTFLPPNNWKFMF